MLTRFRLKIAFACPCLILSIACSSPVGRAADSPAAAAPASSEAAHRGVWFDLDALAKAPEVFPADKLQADGVKAFFYRGLDYQGKPTRIFAYYGVPTSPLDEGTTKRPAMVLIHGGGGTAFDRWVKLWNSRGYAAIAMDLCGCVPVGTYGNWQRHDQGGPPGWDASFDQLDDPIEDQWTYHAASGAILAHSLIRSFPEVDSDRIGVTGISWGGYLTCVVAGLDARFQFAVPVYGCGYLGENSAWLSAFEKLGAEKSKIWLKQWDPAEYLGHAKMPMLWVNGTNDFAYPMDSWQKSYQLPKGTVELCLRVRMPHGHGAAGENPEEVHVFANQILRQGQPLARIIDHGHTDASVWARFESSSPITTAELEFTTDTGRWQDRKWESIPADIDHITNRVTARIPAGAKVCYLNLFDDRQCAISTPHFER